MRIGSVGTYAVQLAKYSGQKLPVYVVLQIGVSQIFRADVVIDYAKKTSPKMVRGMTCFDAVGKISRSKAKDR